MQRDILIHEHNCGFMGEYIYSDKNQQRKKPADSWRRIRHNIEECNLQINHQSFDQHIWK